MHDDFDWEFIKRAQRVTTFNFITKDFESIENRKKEIQYLFSQTFFPKFDLTKTVTEVKKYQLNSLIQDLKKEDPKSFENLYTYNLKGIGPGEVLLYFLIDTAKLGGSSSSGADIITVNGIEYEVKAIQKTSDNYAIDFKLGGTVNLSEYMSFLYSLRDSLGLSDSRKSEIKKTNIDLIKKEEPVKFKQIETDFAYSVKKHYFKDHEIIFLNNKNKSRMGLVESIKCISEQDIKIERITSGTIKPMIYLGD